MATGDLVSFRDSDAPNSYAGIRTGIEVGRSSDRFASYVRLYAVTRPGDGFTTLVNGAPQSVIARRGTGAQRDYLARATGQIYEAGTARPMTAVFNTLRNEAASGQASLNAATTSAAPERTAAQSDALARVLGDSTTVAAQAARGASAPSAAGTGNS